MGDHLRKSDFVQMLFFIFSKFERVCDFFIFLNLSASRVAADARRALLFKQWQRCYADAKTFQHAHIEFTQEGLARLLNAVGSEDSTTMAAVPRDPGRVLSNGNAVVVPNDTRKKLLRTRRRQGAEAYITELAHIDAT